MMLKLDIDRVTKKITRFLICFKKPYFIRVSPSGKGLHMRSDCPGCPRTGDCTECWLMLYDDQRRRRLSFLNRKYGLSHNILNDFKNGRPAGNWIKIETEQDADRFLRYFTGYY